MHYYRLVAWVQDRGLEWWGGYFTAVYLGIITLVLAANVEGLLTLKLNELGDFLAGVFGPVAFLWLVLGYLQQGKELKVSSDALVQQSLELARSVEQQVLSQEHAAQQLKIAQEKLQTERTELAESIRPRVLINFLNSAQSSAGDWLNLELFVYNSSAYDLRVECIYGNVAFEVLKIVSIDDGQKRSFQFEHGKETFSGELFISVYCKNVRGQPFGYQFQLTGSRKSNFKVSQL
jgi:hypothetical protein